MSITVRASRFEHEAIESHRPAEQFKISSAWSLSSLFEGHEKFLDTLKIVCPAIEITNTALPVKAPTGNPF